MTDAVIKTRWRIEKSHMVNIPQFIWSVSLADLRHQVQQIADSKKQRIDRPAIGPVSFRYEMDDKDVVHVVHCYFINKLGKQTRFMRLKLDDES